MKKLLRCESSVLFFIVLLFTVSISLPAYAGSFTAIDPTSANFTAADNASFNSAMDLWNSHQWQKAVEKFKKHLQDHSDSPWAAEAELHLGCFAYFNGDNAEAEARFEKVLNKFPGSKLANKARLRLGNVYFTKNEYEKALDTYYTLRKESSDWNEKKYALHWEKRLSGYLAQRKLGSICGYKSLVICLELFNRAEEGRSLFRLRSTDESGISLLTLLETSREYGLKPWAGRLNYRELKTAQKPLIVLLSNGHFVVVTDATEGTVSVNDPLRGEVTYTNRQFSEVWSGEALGFGKRAAPFWRLLTRREMANLKGGCCGEPEPEDDNDDDDCNGGDSAMISSPLSGGGGGNSGMPSQIKINTVSLNFVIKDTPLFYNPAYGPSVKLTLTYNNDDANTSLFGNSWSFNYGWYYSELPNGNIILHRGGGKVEEFTKSGTTYTPPRGVHDTLVKNPDNTFTLTLKDSKTKYHFNLSQKLSSIEDIWGNDLTLGYDANGILSTITDALGRETSFTTQDLGGDIGYRATRVTLPDGRFAQFTYSNGELTEAVDMAGQSTSYTYNAAGFMKSVTIPIGTTLIDYVLPDHDPAGTWERYKVTMTNPAGQATVYHWDPLYELQTIVTDANDHETCYYPDYYERRTSGFRDADNKSVYYNYDSNGNRNYIRNKNGLATTSVFNDYGDPESVTQQVSAATSITTSYDYYPDNPEVPEPVVGLLKQVSGSRSGEVTDYEYEPNSALKKITSPPDNAGLRPTTEYTYDAATGQILSVKDARNNTTTFAYTYNLDGTWQKTETPPLGSSITYLYDLSGRLEERTDALGTTRYDYDDLDRLTQVTYPDNNTTAYEYSACGCGLSKVTDAEGNVTTYKYDDAGYLWKVIQDMDDNPDNEGVDDFITEYGYDAVGNRTSMKDAEDNLTQYQYNVLNRLVKTTYPDGTYESYTYDAEGNLRTKADCEGNVTQYFYDGLNRVTETRYYE